MYIFPLALLLTNYRCHDSILRLPSNLFFNSTLQVRTNSELHPKTSSALRFVCTSMKSMIVSTEDCSMEEARITLEQVCSILLKYILIHKFILLQVQRFVDPWPEAQWGERDLSSICVMASSKSQVMCSYLTDRCIAMWNYFNNVPM